MVRPTPRVRSHEQDEGPGGFLTQIDTGVVRGKNVFACARNRAPQDLRGDWVDEITGIQDEKLRCVGTRRGIRCGAAAFRASTSHASHLPDRSRSPRAGGGVRPRRAPVSEPSRGTPDPDRGPSARAWRSGPPDASPSRRRRGAPRDRARRLARRLHRRRAHHRHLAAPHRGLRVTQQRVVHRIASGGVEVRARRPGRKVGSALVSVRVHARITTPPFV